MKFSLFSKIIIASLALMLAGSAFAVTKSNFQISTPTQVSGTQLAAGEYQARWDGSGPTVQVTITQGKKVIATVPAQLVAMDEASRYTAIETKSNANGELELTGLLFSGKKYSLKLGTDSASAEGKTASTN